MKISEEQLFERGFVRVKHPNGTTPTFILNIKGEKLYYYDYVDKSKDVPNFTLATSDNWIEFCFQMVEDLDCFIRSFCGVSI